MHPVAFHLGSLPVYWYGVFTAAGILLGLWTASRRGVNSGLAPEVVMDFAPWVIVGVILGARLLHVISYWKEEFAHKPWTEIFMLRQGGLVFYGGLIGASLATIFYTRRKKIPLWKFADVLAPSIALGHALGRLGCLMTGCCFGKECSLPWAIRFPVGHAMHPVGEPAIPVHPTQIYESLLNIALYLFLAWFYRRRKFDGQVFAIYLLCYAALRSFVEMFRADYSADQYFFHGALSPGQFVSIGIFAGGLILLWAKYPPRKSAST